MGLPSLCEHCKARTDDDLPADAFGDQVVSSICQRLSLNHPLPYEGLKFAATQLCENLATIPVHARRPEGGQRVL